MKIFKFGGASVNNAERIRKVSRIVKKYQDEQLVLVISAMGKTTNELEGLTQAYYHKKDHTQELLQSVKQDHFKIMRELFSDESHPVFDKINNIFVEIEWIIEDEPQESYDYLYDQIVSIGEMASTTIISAYLNEQGISSHWLDIRDVIRTDNTHREGRVQWDITENSIKEKIPVHLNKGIVVTQGFLGGTSENFTTTLGREGSDFTAAILANVLEAEGVYIWKDVAGVLNADPRYFKDHCKIDHLNYAEAIEMAFFGAKVIHPKTIKPLQNKNIPLYVCSFEDPEAKGTLIDGSANIETIPPVIVLKKDLLLLVMRTKDFSFISDKKFGQVHDIFVRHNIKVRMIQHSAVTLSVCIDNEPAPAALLLNDLKEHFHVYSNEKCELLTIRHYDEETIKRLTANRQLLLEQKGLDMMQVVVK